MKQRITPDQLFELSDKAKKRLKTWWNPQKGDFFAKEYPKDYCKKINEENEHWNKYSKIRNKLDNSFKLRIRKTDYKSEDFKMELPILIINNDWKESKRLNVTYPLLSIGQMIEFLDQKKGSWTSYVIKEVYDLGDIQILYEADELCDALWGAVKEILESD